MVPYDITHERLMDIVIILVLIGMYIGIYVYGRWQYDRGYHDGLSDKRKINREIRRGNIYRLK
jgi:hypothetical protein